jgi:molybdate transport system substrate-binding protein
MKLRALSCGLALIAALSSDGMVQAAEVKALASNSVRTMLEDVALLFERASGHKVTLGFGTSAQVAKRMLAGEAADVVVITPEAVDRLAKEGKVVSGSRAEIARSLMGIGMRAGAPRPDIATSEALKRTLLAAKSVTFSDPATGAESGLHTVRIFERLGIAAEMKPKYRLGDGTTSGQLVVSGEAELAIWQISAMKAVAGIEVVGPLPAELQLVTHLSAGIAAGATAPDAAKALIGFFASPEAAAAIRARGLEPGGGS